MKHNNDQHIAQYTERGEFEERQHDALQRSATC